MRNRNSVQYFCNLNGDIRSNRKSNEENKSPEKEEDTKAGGTPYCHELRYM